VTATTSSRCATDDQALEKAPRAPPTLVKPDLPAFRTTPRRICFRYRSPDELAPPETQPSCGCAPTSRKAARGQAKEDALLRMQQQVQARTSLLDTPPQRERFRHLYAQCPLLARTGARSNQ